MPEPFPDTMPLPRPEMPREEQQEQFLRDMEIDPHKYYPPDADREPVQVWPDEGFHDRPQGDAALAWHRRRLRPVTADSPRSLTRWRYRQRCSPRPSPSRS